MLQQSLQVSERRDTVKNMTFKRTGFAIVLTVLMSLFLAACGSATTAPATTAPASVATTAPAAAATTAPAAAVVAPTVAPVANGDKTGVTDTEIKIGTFTPQTGGAAAYGLSARVIEKYFQKINEEGGINGRKIKYIYEDDQYTASKSLIAAKKMIEQDKIFALIGCIGTANNLQVRQYLDESKLNVPNLMFSTGNSTLVNPPRKDWFGFLPTYPFEAQVFVEFASKELKSKKVAIVYQNDGFGKDGQQSFAKAAPTKGMEIVAEIPYETGATDLSSQALKAQQSGADTVYVMAVPGPGAVLLKEFDKLGYKPKMLLSFVLNDTSFFAASGKASDGIYTTNFTPLPDGDDPKLVEFRDFMKKYLPNEQASQFALWGYNAAQIFIEGLKRAGKDLSREGIVAALETIQNYNGTIIKDFTFGANNRAPIKSMYIMQYKDQKFTKISDWITVAGS
jgi:branched-chain amino acid transport system substrate-binding protein